MKNNGKHSEESFIPYGYQYYRWPTPERDQWEKDLAQIAELGFNTVKYFLYWRISHPQPDRFYYDDVLELMDLAHKYNLKVIINLIFDVAPVWIYQQYPECKMITADGETLEPVSLGSRSVGGAPGPCFHHEPSNHWKAVFLQQTVAVFKDHPALWVWDLWNEPELTVTLKRELSFANQVCYCANCLTQFPQWLECKYGSLDVLNEKWKRNYQLWSEIEAPRVAGTINDMVDWRSYFVDTIVDELIKRIDGVKSLDTINPVMCHTVPSPYFNIVTAGSDDFKLAEPCDLFGNSVGSSTWASDLFVAAAKGKKLINAEIHATGGDMVSKNRKLAWKDLKKQILIPLARGTSGFVFWQYRPETLGIEAPAWGATYMDGSVTPWLENSALLNSRIQQYKELICNGGRPSDKLVILYSDESQIANFAMFGHLQTFEHSLQGTHKLLHDLNYKVEFIHQMDVNAQSLAAYQCLWMPFPIYLGQQLSDTIRGWVADGGSLIAECSFGMLQAETGKHSYVVPGYGFDQVFGVKEKWMHFIGDTGNHYTTEASLESTGAVPMNWNGLANADSAGLAGSEPTRIYGSYYQSEVACAEDTQVLATYAVDGTPAITVHPYGDGKAIYIGSLFGAEYWQRSNGQTRDAVKQLLSEVVGITPLVDIAADSIRVDFWQTAGEGHIAGDAVQTIYYVQNLADYAQQVEIPVGNGFKHCHAWFDEAEVALKENILLVDIEAGDFQVFVLS